MPSVAPQTQRNVTAPAPPAQHEDDRTCAGCNKSVSSETGGVVVAFGNSLWHVDCFKCAKCGNQVNADTNLLLLSDGSPVCANCYNCKVCKLAILDEAVMTGDDSFHAECFTCRSCKNRIDELVFAKTSQGFYCMKCHNERVARSRRHIAKQKQRERERQASGNGPSRPTTAGSSSRVRDNDTVNVVTSPPDNETSRTKYASGGSSSDSHPKAVSSSQPSSRTSHPSDSGGTNPAFVPPTNTVNSPSAHANSEAGAAVPLTQHSDSNHRSTPAPPAVSVTVAGPSNVNITSEESAQPRSLPDSHVQESAINGEVSGRRPSLDGPPPPPYSKTPPPNNGNSDVESARSSASYGYNASTEPTSPSLSVSVSHEGSHGDHGIAGDRRAPAAPASLNSGSRERADSLTPRGHSRERSSGAGWLPELEQDTRRKSYDDGASPLSAYLQPKPATTIAVSKKREKRGSINPGLQLEASKMLQMQSERTGTSPSSSPAGTPSGSHARTQSPTAQLSGRDSPHVTSPLRDYFVGVDEDSSGSTTFYSPSASPKLTSPTSPHGTPVPSARPNSPLTSKKDFPLKFPQRSDSLRNGNSTAAVNSPPPSATRTNGLPSSPYNSRLHTPTPPLRTQRSFEGRGGRRSPRQTEFDVDSGKRSRSVSPKPPDVPRSIESGTDTETDAGNDSDDVARNYTDYSQGGTSHKGRYPPVPPPKDAKNDNVPEARRRSPSQPLSLSEPSSAGPADGDVYFEREHEDSPSLSSVTQRTSGFFIAPALPPMRFSMNGTDFRELLSNIGESPSKSLSTLHGRHGSQSGSNSVTIPEEKEADVAAPRTPTSVASTVTPLTSTTFNGLEASRKPPERKPSLRSRRISPPGPLHMDANVDRIDGIPSSSSSPTSANRTHIRKTSPHGILKSDSAAKILDEASSPRSSAESRRPASPKVSSNGAGGRGSLDRNGSTGTGSPRLPVIAVSRNGVKQDSAAELVTRRLKEALSDANDRLAEYIKLDRAFVEAIISSLDQKGEQMSEMTNKLDGMKRTSQMMFDGLSVAQSEYSQELEARRNAEEEVSRLKIELSGQAARLTALSSDERKREVQQQLTKELSDNLNGLEQDLSKLRVERDMTLAEVEELSASKSSANGDVPAATLGRSLTVRLDNIKRQYQHELVPLTQQREALVREILELKEARDIFLEETAVLNARNEELAQLISQYERRSEAAQTSGHSRDKSLPPVQSASGKQSFDTWKARQPQAPAIVNTTSTSSSATLIDDTPENRQQKSAKPDNGDAHVAQRPRIGLRWPGNKASKDTPANNSSVADNGKGKKRIEHAFQQLSILRFARCDLCGDKMWGSQVRCSSCNLSVHARCVGQVHTSCVHDAHATISDEHLASVGPPPPSMFGRDLIEQVRDDSKHVELFVPVIVEKCIDAVEALGMDYEGIYRKTGGSGQSKAITSLFERGNYEAFDLCDTDSFNDISSVTSVLKNYFRSLPNPLLTYGLHEAFVGAAGVKDTQIKGQALKDLVRQLPAEHYHTLARLMTHLHRVQLQADVNLMTARNLGVIFGPTLMRSQDPSREFADMAGKSLSVEWLIENAPSVFPSPSF